MAGHDWVDYTAAVGTAAAALIALGFGVRDAWQRRGESKKKFKMFAFTYIADIQWTANRLGRIRRSLAAWNAFDDLNPSPGFDSVRRDLNSARWNKAHSGFDELLYDEDVASALASALKEMDIVSFDMSFAEDLFKAEFHPDSEAGKLILDWQGRLQQCHNKIRYAWHGLSLYVPHATPPQTDAEIGIVQIQSNPV